MLLLVNLLHLITNVLFKEISQKTLKVRRTLQNISDGSSHDSLFVRGLWALTTTKRERSLFSNHLGFTQILPSYGDPIGTSSDKISHQKGHLRFQ